MSVADQSLFAGKEWKVHKFGGTSVASAECFLQVVQILEGSLGSKNETADEGQSGSPNLAVVVSAMGGKPKTTDLLLSTVEAAAARDDAAVQTALTKVMDKHNSCLSVLFADVPSEKDRLMEIVRKDLEDIKDILKTVALMKWQADRISELISGYGETWSTQILAALLQMRASASSPRGIAKDANKNSFLQPSDIPEPSLSLSMDEDDETESNKVTGQRPTHEFVYVDARRVIIIDEDAIQHGSVCWDISQTKLQDVYEEACSQVHPQSIVHLVCTGFICSNTHGVATTLQRDGSDYSAAIMGRLLSATQINIWTDVDGCLSADPRRVPGAYVIPDVSYNEAMELSYFGAKVIHPKTMQPAISADPQIPIYIRNTFNPTFRGTRIYTVSTTSSTESDKCVCGFSSIEGMALVNVEGTGMMGVPGVANRLFGTLEKNQINVVLISQSSSEHSITFATKLEHVIKAKETLQEEFRREITANRITDIDVRQPCSIIAAVGDGMSNVAGVSGRFFSALGAAKINVLAISQGCSERNISAVVRTSESTRALRAIHAAFRLSHTTVRVGIVGVENNEIGESLLKLLQAQRDKLRSIFDVDLQVCAIVPSATSEKIVKLTTDKPGSSESITSLAYKDAMAGVAMDESTVSFRDHSQEIAKAESGGLKSMESVLYQEECTHHVLFDCTSDSLAGQMHASWLRSGIHIVTANNAGLSGPKEQLDEIREAEKLHGKNSAQYLREVTVGGALPVITTLHSLLDSGDRIRRMDGIMSVSMSYIMHRVSPPPRGDACLKFDESFSSGTFKSDAHSDEPCLFSEAIKEAVALGLTEEDPTMDLNNDHTSKNLMVLAQELGVERTLSAKDIQATSEKLLEVCSTEGSGKAAFDYQEISTGALDQEIKNRGDAARERGCVLRHISSVDVRSHEIKIQIVEVPDNHVFALTPPSCETVRFFTQRHETYPLIVQGPSAGADSTASALLAELLHLMREKVGPRKVLLTRRGSASLFSSNSFTGLA